MASKQLSAAFFGQCIVNTNHVVLAIFVLGLAILCNGAVYAAIGRPLLEIILQGDSALAYYKAA